MKLRQKLSKALTFLLSLAMVLTSLVGFGSNLNVAMADSGETVSVELATTIEEGEQYIILGYSNSTASNCALSTDNGQYASQRLAIDVETNLSTPSYNPSYTDAEIEEVTFSSESDMGKCLWTAEASGTDGVWYFSNTEKYLQRNYAATYWDTDTSYTKEWLFYEYDSTNGRYCLKGNEENYYLAKSSSNNYFNCATGTSYAAGIYHVIADDPTQPHMTVSFETNGGSAVEQQSVMTGKKVKEPVTTQDGKVFKGWFSDEELTTAYNFDTAISITENSSMTLYAKWADAVTVTFNSNGGSDVDAQTIEKGTAAVKPDDPTKSASEFVGWYADEDLTTTFDFTAAVNADTT